MLPCTVTWTLYTETVLGVDFTADYSEKLQTISKSGQMKTGIQIIVPSLKYIPHTKEGALTHTYVSLYAYNAQKGTKNKP